MHDPTFVEQLDGILSAIVTLVLAGSLYASLRIFVERAGTGESIHDETGFISNVIEPDDYPCPRDFGGLLPDVSGAISAIAVCMATYLALTFSFLAVLFATVLFTPYTLPIHTSLYLIAGIATLVGLSSYHRVERQVRSSEWYRGY